MKILDFNYLICKNEEEANKTVKEECRSATRRTCVLKEKYEKGEKVR